MLFQRLPVVGAAFLLMLAGCASGDAGEERGAAVPQTQAPQPQEAEPQKEEVLHGVGRCDQCHEALSLEDIRAGVHEQGFALFEGHREFCRECHDVEETCTRCHGMPEGVQ